MMAVPRTYEECLEAQRFNPGGPPATPVAKQATIPALIGELQEEVATLAERLAQLEATLAPVTFLDERSAAVCGRSPQPADRPPSEMAERIGGAVSGIRELSRRVEALTCRLDL